jgi:hypothetical protein
MPHQRLRAGRFPPPPGVRRARRATALERSHLGAWDVLEAVPEKGEARMNLKMVGLIAALTLGGATMAKEQQKSQQSSQMQKSEESGKGGSGQAGQMGSNELNGTVVGYRTNEVLIKGDNGAVVPLKLTSRTQVDGKPINKSKNIESSLRKEFKEGDQVRTSFDVQKDSNIARSLDKSQGQQGQQEQKQE